MKAVNVDDVLKILYKYRGYVFVTDELRYSDMVDEIANLKPLKQESILSKIRAEILSIGKYEEYRELMPNFELEQVIKIIDRYRGEENETDN